MKLKFILFIALFLAVSAEKSFAVPTYARNLKVSCTQCHTAFPMLNKYGRRFKESLAGSLKQQYSDSFQSIANPLSARLKFRPYDKTTTSTSPVNMRSLHEVEVFITGRTGKVFYNAEMEAEDETPTLDNTNVESGFGLNAYFSQAYVGYQVKHSLNLLAGLASPMAFDALGTVHHHNIMRGQWMAESFLPQKSQFLSLAGRMKKISYIVSFYGDSYAEGNVAANGVQGQKPQNMLARVRYNLMGQNFGFLYASEKGGDVTRFALDSLLEFGDLSARAIFVSKNDTAQKDKNTDLSLELYYIFGDLTPMMGIDKYTNTNGKDSYTNGQFALLYNLADNVRVNVNYEKKISVAKNESRDGRLSLRGEVAF